MRTIIIAAVVALATSAVAGNTYEDAALAEARKQALTAEQVAAQGYPDIAALAGVKLGGDGSSPAKFFYVHVRRHVVRTLAAEEKAARVNARQAEVQAKLREAFPDAEITVSEDGTEFTIKNLPPDPEVGTEVVAAAERAESNGAMFVTLGTGVLMAGAVVVGLRRRSRRSANV